MPETKKTEAKATEPKKTTEGSISALEKWLVETNKQLPQIPKGGRDTLAQIAPWLALIGGVLSLFAAWGFWQAGHTVNKLIELSNSIYQTYGGSQAISSPTLGFTWYLSLVLLLVQAVLLLVAFPKLKEGKKFGWTLLFYNSLLTAAIGLAYAVTPRYGVSSLFMYLIGTAISLYLVFQIRDHFTK